jgi:AraC-like DNA-binding protein
MTKLAQIERQMLNRTPTAYALNLIEDARQSGHDLLATLNISQMELVASQNMAFEDFNLVVDAYEDWTTNRDWGFHLGKKLGITAHGALGVCALSANTIGEGLDVLCRFMATRSCSINAEVIADNSHLRAEFLHTGQMRRHLKAMTENLAVVVTNFLVTVAGRDDLELRWTFPYPKPEDISLYHRELPGSFAFDGSMLSIVVPEELIKQPSLLRDKNLHQATRLQCGEELREVQQNPDFSYVTSLLSSALIKRLGEVEPMTRLPTTEDLARHLNMSPRTLIRRLKSNHTTLREIKDALVRDYMQDMLSRGIYSVTDIAIKLGYENPGNFTRACKRLLGVTPNSIRRARL